MFSGANIQVGAGRYFQHSGALKVIGEECLYWGNKVYIVTDEIVWAKTGKIVTESLRTAGVPYVLDIVNAPSCQHTFEQVAASSIKNDADVFVGLGGGRVIDIAKGASKEADCRIITAPTSAATCSAYTILYVSYGNDGSVLGSLFMDREASAVLTDINVVIGDCQERYLISGIADAMAKKPEFAFTMMHIGEDSELCTSHIAANIADYTYNYYLNHTHEALEDFRAGRCSDTLENVVCANIMLTGMVSNLSTGGKQLAIAHNVYDAVCYQHKSVREQYLHGEIVGLALPLQLAVNGSSSAEIREMRDFLKSIGVPTSLKAIGVPTDGDTVETMIKYTHFKTDPDDIILLEQIRDSFSEIL